MQCCVHARERRADCGRGRDHWEDLMEQVSVHLDLELCRLLMEGRCFRQREGQWRRVWKEIGVLGESKSLEKQA